MDEEAVFEKEVMNSAVVDQGFRLLAHPSASMAQRRSIIEAMMKIAFSTGCEHGIKQVSQKMLERLDEQIAARSHP